MDTSSLTVVIPAFNAENTIGIAVASAINAGASRVIVVDDGSLDGTREAAASVGAEVVTQTNAGASAARAKGARLVESDYVIFLDADDALIGEGVRKSLDLLRKDMSFDVVAGRIMGFVGSSIEVLQPATYTDFTTTSLLSEGFGPWPPGAGVLRTSALREAENASPPPLRPRYAEDYELLIRMSLVGNITRHETPSLRYEMGGGKSSRSVSASMRAMTSKEAIRRHYADALGIAVTLAPAARLRAAAHKRVARGLTLGGKHLKAGRHMVLAYVHGAVSLMSKRERVGAGK